MPAKDLRVYSHSYWPTIFVQPIAALFAWRGRGRQKFVEKKATIFPEHPVDADSLQCFETSDDARKKGQKEEERGRI